MTGSEAAARRWSHVGRDLESRWPLVVLFNRAGLLAPADVHVADRLAALVGETDEAVVLAAAYCVRAARVSSVSVDLTSVRGSAVADSEESAADLPWPEPRAWTAAVAASAMVAGPEGPDDRPLRQWGSLLYLDRYWRDEVAVAADLRARAEADPPSGTAPVAVTVDRLFAGPADDRPRQAAAIAADRRLAVVCGGPGTGKTTTVARLVAALDTAATAGGGRPPLVALAAPTGKAAARLQEAVQAAAAGLDVPDAVRRRLAGLQARTIHRLLGGRPGMTGTFRHHGAHRLPMDLVVVDEASMVSLPLMARLLDALRPDAHLVLVGDPGQLVSVEAGAVLADMTAGAGALSPCTVELTHNHRFSGAISDLAAAVRAGHADRALDLLAGGDATLTWIDCGPGDASDRVGPVVFPWASELVAAATEGRAGDALDLLSSHRLLVAHRRGPAGVGAWNRMVEDRAAGAGAPGGWYAGRPVLVSANDYALHLFNGDQGVAVASASGPLEAVFPAPSGHRHFRPQRLARVETVFAMTVHKSQGSEFDAVTLVLPDADSPLLTRELLYTALTRARRSVTVVATEAALRRAVGRPAGRASGLAARLAAPV